MNLKAADTQLMNAGPGIMRPDAWESAVGVSAYWNQE